MTGLIDSQFDHWDKVWGVAGMREVSPSYQLWTWVDRYNPSYNLLPSYTTAGSRVEAFTVTSAANSTDQANLWGADATLYNGGATLTAFFALARQLNPIFLIVDTFNSFASNRDEGVDIEHSNDIEPTKQWGFTKFNVAEQDLLAYRAGYNSATTSVLADPKTSFITSLYQCILAYTPSSGEVTAWLSAPANSEVSWFYRSFFDYSGYIAYATTNDRYVRQMYQCVLGRAGNSQEITQWTTALANGTSRDSVLNSFLNYSEFQNNYGKLISAQTGYPL